MRHRLNPQRRQRFLTAEPALDPLAACADLLDGLLHGARRIPGLLRLVAHLVILPASDPGTVLLAPAA